MERGLTRHLRLCLAGATLAAVACAAGGQQVYRIVGPDGRIIFSDRPPPDRDALPLRRGSATAAAPGSAAAIAAAAAVPPNTPLPETAAMQALRKGLTALVHAEQVVASVAELCAAARPSSVASYTGPAQRWRERHATLLARRDAILQQGVAPRQRADLVDAARVSTRRTLEPAHQADVPRRIAWCDRFAARIDAGDMDRHGDPEVSGPLLAWQAR